MFEFDMHEAEFVAPAAHEPENRQADWSPLLEFHAEPRLVSVAESEAERR